jgi:hypothetical protein
MESGGLQGSNRTPLQHSNFNLRYEFGAWVARLDEEEGDADKGSCMARHENRQIH